MTLRKAILSLFVLVFVGSGLSIYITNLVFNVAYHLFVMGLSLAILLGAYFSQTEIDRREIAAEKKRLKKRYNYAHGKFGK
jgi:hypothetical protein